MIGNLRLIHLIPIFYVYLQTMALKSYGESPLVNVTAVMEGRALLPCNITTSAEDDQPVMIMFYRNNTGTPIYTVDLRSQHKSHVKHLPSPELKSRAGFELKTRKSGLLIKNIWSTDDGLYRCRVDFKKSPTKNSRIRLIVIVPPDSVRIEDETGSERSSTIGPYVLGQTLALTCLARGGRPPPRLTWYANHKPVRGTVLVKKGEVANTLKIPSLQRHHLHQSYECHASNDKQVVPVSGAVTIDMTLPPLSVRIRGLNNPISAGVGVTAICEIIGARPEPTITWWLDGQPLHALQEESEDSGNFTESKIILQLTREDQGRYLSCRAETPGLLQSTLEEGVKLNVHYSPSVRITADPKVNVDDVREGDDVRLTCSIKAEPPPTSISWYHNNHVLTRNSSVLVEVSNVSLLIQKTSRESSGSYVCKASNEEGEGSSRPVDLKIKFAPVCSPKQKLVYGVARGEMISVFCRVNAHPPHVSFEWRFNNSIEEKRISEAHITNNWTISQLTYTPSSRRDYGHLYCTASNFVGRQEKPCVFRIFPAGPPDSLKNCSVINESLDSVEVHCVAGFDGGLPQDFIMEVFETRGRKLKSNVTSKSASFTVRGLPSGLHLSIRLYSANAKGRSPVTELKATTPLLKNGLLGVQPTELPSTMELSPSLTIILGVIGGILVVFIVIVVVMVVRRPRRDSHHNIIQQDDSSLQILKKDDSQNGRMDGDEKDPDIIPEARGSRNDSIDRTLSSVPTIYGDIVKNHQVKQHILCDSQPSAQAHIHHNAVSQDKANGNIQHSLENQINLSTSSSSRFCPLNEFQAKPSSNMAIFRQPNHRHNHYHTQSSSTTQQFPSAQNHMNPPPEHQLSLYQHSAIAAPTHPSVIPPCYTQTLPHPRSSHGRGSQVVSVHPKHIMNHNLQTTLVRRGSLYMDPCIQPIAPPPPYNSLDKPEMGAVVPLVSETVRITPNPPCGVNGIIMSPPEPFPPKPFPSSFASEQDKDRMESSV